MLSLAVPLWILDAGALPAGAKPWWTEILDGQRTEIEATFGKPRILNSLGDISGCQPPGVLIVPALAGGCAGKRDWWTLRGALEGFARRGGLVLVLNGAFCLHEDDQKARGRHFEYIDTSTTAWLDHPVHFAGSLDPATEAGWGFFAEIRTRSGADSRVETLAVANSGIKQAQLVVRFAESPRDSPGALLFITTWGGARHALSNKKKGDLYKNSVSVEKTIGALRALNQKLVNESLGWVQARSQQRLRRLEALSGETERLVRKMGSEKDYQRLLANDVPLCIDVVGWRDLVEGSDVTSRAFRTAFEGGACRPEPPHNKPSAKKGRLDLLLFPKDSGPEDNDKATLEAWLKGEPGTPVAWLELEAAEFDQAQMCDFFDANRTLFRKDDFICAVDRSRDDAEPVKAFRAEVTAAGYRFIHVEIPMAFNRLEEYYAPLMHRLSRKRFTTEVIRGLVG